MDVKRKAEWTAGNRLLTPYLSLAQSIQCSFFIPEPLFLLRCWMAYYRVENIHLPQTWSNSSSKQPVHFCLNLVCFVVAVFPPRLPGDRIDHVGEKKMGFCTLCNTNFIVLSSMLSLDKWGKRNKMAKKLVCMYNIVDCKPIILTPIAQDTCKMTFPSGGIFLYFLRPQKKSAGNRAKGKMAHNHIFMNHRAFSTLVFIVFESSKLHVALLLWHLLQTWYNEKCQRMLKFVRPLSPGWRWLSVLYSCFGNPQVPPPHHTMPKFLQHPTPPHSTPPHSSC